jgi:hypothetical protein
MLLDCCLCFLEEFSVHFPGFPFAFMVELRREAQHFKFCYRQGRVNYGWSRILLFKSYLFPSPRRHPLGQAERFHPLSNTHTL